jgi:putative endonuclease
MASGRNGTLYVGVTADLLRRVIEHRDRLIPGFTAKYNVKNLVYYEEHADMSEAIAAEKRLRKWKRLWKIRLIEKINPDWSDLFADLQD